jgi:competence protein ComEA
MVAWAVAAVLVALAAVRAFRASGEEGAPPPVRVDGGNELSGGASGERGARGRSLYVHVAGAVRRPGLYRVPEGSRVAAAVERAGGPARGANLTGVNLAQPLEDGRQVVIPLKGAPPAGVAAPAGGPEAGTGGGAGGAPLSLTTATAQQLDELDGIGPTLAKRIVEYREAHGGFRSLGELRQVEGIGEKRFAALKEALQP